MSSKAVAPNLPPWMTSATKAGIGRKQLRKHLANTGFCQLLQGKKRTADTLLLHRHENIVREVPHTYVKEFLENDLQSLNCPEEALDAVFALSKRDIDAVTKMLPQHAYGGTVPGGKVVSLDTPFEWIWVSSQDRQFY